MRIARTPRGAVPTPRRAAAQAARSPSKQSAGRLPSRAAGNQAVAAYIARIGNPFAKAPEAPFYERRESLVADFDPAAHDEAYRGTKIDPAYVWMNGRSMADLLSVSQELHGRLAGLGGAQYLIDRLSGSGAGVNKPRLHVALEATLVRGGGISAAAFELNAERRLASWSVTLEHLSTDDRAALLGTFPGGMAWVAWVKAQAAFAELDPDERVWLRLALCDLPANAATIQKAKDFCGQDTPTGRQMDVAGLRGLVKGQLREAPASGAWQPGVKWFAASGQLAAVQPGETQPATPRDVTQGAVGDCWFVSAAGAIAAADPAAVKRMITDHGDGTYTVTLHLLDAKGVRQAKPVNIDAKLPQTAGGAALGAAGPDLWVGLLEKALAAVLGGYDQIGGGSSEEALAILSGISGTTIDLAALGERGFDEIATALAEKKPVVANTPHALHLKDSLKDNQPLLLSRLTQRALLGIPEGGHQWMVAAADPSGRKVTVRNPWGGATADITITSAQFVALWSTAVIGSAPPPAPSP